MITYRSYGICVFTFYVRILSIVLAIILKIISTCLTHFFAEMIRLHRGSLVLGRKLKETPQAISPPGVRRAQQHLSISSAAMVAVPRHPVLLALMNRCLDLLIKKPTPWVPLWAMVESALEKTFAFDPGKVDPPPAGALVLPLGAMSSIGPDASHGESGASLFSVRECSSVLC